MNLCGVTVSLYWRSSIVGPIPIVATGQANFSACPV